MADLDNAVTPIEPLAASLAKLEAEQVTLHADLREQNIRLINEVGALKDDINLLAARLQGIDSTMRALIDETRAVHCQEARLTAHLTEIDNKGQSPH